MHIPTLTDWGNSALVMAWKLTEQEMKQRKLDLSTWRERRLVRDAGWTTKARFGITPEESKASASINSSHWGTQEWMATTRVRVVALAQQLVANTPSPMPPGFTSSTEMQEDTSTQMQEDDSIRCIRYIVSFDADAQEIVTRFVSTLVADSGRTQRQARDGKKGLAELGTMGSMCKWDTVIELGAEDIRTRTITKTPVGSPRRASYVCNVANTEAVVGVSKEELEYRGDGGTAGPSPGLLRLMSCFTHPMEHVDRWAGCMRAALLSHFGEPSDPACPSTRMQYEREVKDGDNSFIAMMSSAATFDTSSGPSGRVVTHTACVHFPQQPRSSEAAAGSTQLEPVYKKARLSGEVDVQVR